ncbi:MAG: hypothetical protein COY53_02005 [Elusimicrobia bacterium CG_4_10_14_0_8_um_filter_37_32]|nr:MAG: hypothetical protein COS17_07620 [Elusimicrobia bacterium CG02_land_8_20_14_3_00_37_13]PIZ13988.1 MAG: hypothetical protein COY53_02005 [Elusimicrobia bacterium CG_4_10_14_0_8_um_filter_37_32]
MYEIINKILKVFEENKLWDEGIELIGSWCFNLYQKYLGVKSYPLRTQDIDFLIPIPYKSKKHLNLIAELEKLGFQHSFNSSGSIYLWNSELKIEFIAPKKGEGLEKTINIKNLSVKAIPLRFVDILFIEPIQVNDNGVKILIPNPASFCLQKIIVAFRRKNLAKKLKDLEQAIRTFEIVDKEKLKYIYSSFPKKWQKKIIVNLEKSKSLLPLLEERIDKIILTLQNIK